MIWTIVEIEEAKCRLPREFAKYAKEKEITHYIKFFEQFNIKNGELYYDGEKISVFPKLAVFRGYVPELYVHLEKRGVRIINSAFTIDNCRDKLATKRILDKNGISSPKTLHYKTPITYKDICTELGTEFIVKDRFGRGGTATYLIKNESDLNKVLEKADIRRMLFQEYIKTSYGKDVRAYVVGSKIIATFLRADGHDFRSNITQGGKAFPYEMTKEQQARTLRINEILKGEIVAIDYLLGGDDLVLCETNSNPGVGYDYTMIGFDIPKMVFEYISEQYFTL